VIDAVNFARHHTTVDEQRIYLGRLFGGAWKSLVLAGQHPELWPAWPAWVASMTSRPGTEDHGRDVHYLGEIAASAAACR